jgi:uncharacterized protein (TIGR00251 family)
MMQQSLITRKNNQCAVKVKVFPRSSKNTLAGIKNNELTVKIKGLPEKGKANIELMKFFAKLLGISRSQVEISSGQKSQHKTIVLPVSCYENILHIIKNQS